MPDPSARETHPAATAKGRRWYDPRWVIGRILKITIATIILGIAVLLPYRARVWYSDKLGRAINSVFHGYIRALRWFFRKLES